jgi:kinesin family protein 11
MCSCLSVINTENENGLLSNLQVDTKLLDLRKTGISSKSFMDEHVSSMGDILSCSKTKWQRICTQAEKDARDTAEFSVAKHGYMEELLQQR